MATKSIVWLASYPKSGNTWVRIFLANYFLSRGEAVPINQVHRIGIGDAIPKTYSMVSKGPFDPASHQQALALRGKVLKAIVANGADLNFVKTHNAKTRAFGVDLIPPAMTRMAVYIIRNPLDMVLSYARHFGMSPDAAAEAIGRSDNTTAGTAEAVPQYLGTWSEHVRSWTRTKEFPVHLMRYEDMLAAPEEAFGSLLRRLGVTPDPRRLEQAVRFSSFSEVKKQENQHGFVERSSSEQTFFHSGTAGQWKRALAPESAERILREHAAVMAEYGYAKEATAASRASGQGAA